VTAIREALDSNTDLAIDAHWAYAPVDIIKVMRALEGLDLLWLEDPVPAENVEVMKMVKELRARLFAPGRTSIRALVFAS
jgi:galactonate dehydratase